MSGDGFEYFINKTTNASNFRESEAPEHTIWKSISQAVKNIEISNIRSKIWEVYYE